MTSVRCLRYGHKEKRNSLDEKICLIVLFRLLEFLTLRFDAF